MTRVISDAAMVVAAKDQFSCPLGDDTVILDLKAGLYFSLDNVGAMVWRLIQQPRTVKDVRRAILDEFEVSEEVCGRDLQALLNDLAERGLIEVQNGSAA